ncbi:Protein-L-isoaspartate(D-aspartate) O-methyltransferase, partial [mine drainage metagenome]
MSEGRDALLAELGRDGPADPAVLTALAAVSRELFLPPELADLAYHDRALSIGWGQTCSQPRIVAMTVAALAVAGGERVLEVGAGSGYRGGGAARCRRR